MNTVHENKQANYGWGFLFVVAILQTLAATMLLFGSGPATFEADTGVAWEELTDVFPTVAAQFEGAQQASVIGTLGIGLFSLFVSYFPFRSGQRWSWFAMWILPLSSIPGIVSLARTENQAGVAVFGGIIVLIAVAGLLLAIRNFFPRQPANA